MPRRLSASSGCTAKRTNQDNDEAQAALQYRRDFCFASGHNVAVNADGITDEQPDRAFTLTTTWLPTAGRACSAGTTCRGTKCADGDGIADLAQSEQVIDRLLPMVKAYRGWISQQPKHQSDKDQNDTAKLRAQAEDCAKRIENGIQLLSDPLVKSLPHECGDGKSSAAALSIRQGRPDQIGIAEGTRTPGWRFSSWPSF